MLSVVEACGQRPLRSPFDYAQDDIPFVYLPTTNYLPSLVQVLQRNNFRIVVIYSSNQTL
jgi:hypothetical protein